MDMSDKKPVITAIRMLKNKGALGKSYLKGHIYKAGPGEDIGFQEAFHFVAARHADNLTADAGKLKKGKDGWELSGGKPEPAPEAAKGGK